MTVPPPVKKGQIWLVDVPLSIGMVSVGENIEEWEVLDFSPSGLRIKISTRRGQWWATTSELRSKWLECIREEK